ncbi:hypothetical protein ACLB2K_003484 [Fragaria x ananassa]
MLLVLWLSMSVGTWGHEESESWSGWLSKSLGFTHGNEVKEPKEKHVTQDSALNMKVLLTVQQNIHASFNAIHQEQPAKAQEMLKIAVMTLNHEESLSDEEKSTILTQYCTESEKFLNEEQKVKAQELLKAATTGLRIHLLNQADMEKEKQYGSNTHAPTPSVQGSSQNTNVLLDVQQKLQASFQAIQQGQQTQGQDMLVDAIVALKLEKTLTVEQKGSKLTELVKNCEKSLNKETQEIAEMYLQGAQVGLRINMQLQAGAASDTFANRSSQNTDILLEVQQKLQAAFQTIQQGKNVEVQEMLKVIVTILLQEKSLTVEQKAAKLTVFVKNIEKSLNKETQVIAEQFLLGAKVALKINQSHQVDTDSRPSAPRSSQNTDVLLTVQKKLQAAFLAIQQGQQAQGQQILVEVTVALKLDKSLTIEQKVAKLTEFVTSAKKSLNKETQDIADIYLEGAQLGLSINQQLQVDTASSPSAQGNTSQNANVLVDVQQKIHAAFQIIQQGKKVEGEELLKAIATIFMREKSLTVEQKAAKLTEFVKNAEKSLNKETQLIAEEFLLGAQVVLNINQPYRDATASGPSATGSSQNTNVLLMIQKNLEAGFQAIQQGQQTQGQEMVVDATVALKIDKSLTIEQKVAKLTELVKNCEKSLNKETQEIAEKYLEGAKVGLNINQQLQFNTAFDPFAQGSSQTKDVLRDVQQKLHTAFQVIQQGKKAEGEEMLKVCATVLMRENSLPIEQKVVKLTEFVKNVEMSLNKETQVIAEEFLLGAQVALKINQPHQGDTNIGPSAQGGSHNTDVLLMVQKKLQAGFQAIQQGQQAQGQGMLIDATVALTLETSLTVEQKAAKLIDFVKDCEKSLNKETQEIAEKFLQGAQVGLRINQQHQATIAFDPYVHGGSQNTDVFLEVQQKLNAAFQAIQEGKIVEGQEMLKVITMLILREKSLPVEQKSAKLIECVKNAEKSLNKETQVIAEEFLLGIQVALKINYLQ